MRQAGRKSLSMLCLIFLAAGCGGESEAGSMSKRVSARVEAEATCVKAGVQEVAAERTRIYRCTWEFADRKTSPCYAVVDGDLLDVTDRADESFECSHVAARKLKP